MKFFFIKLIKLYQSTLSPDHGLFKARWPYGFCRFYPTCSQYAVEALTHKNIFSASFLIIKRILRCNPFTSPKIDPVPKI